MFLSHIKSFKQVLYIHYYVKLLDLESTINTNVHFYASQNSITDIIL